MTAGKCLTAILVCTAALCSWVSQTVSEPDGANTVSGVLDALHDAASKADGKRYFDLFTIDAVFLGTDETERWPIDEFKTYAMKRFETGTGWTYTLKPGTRHIVVEGNIAWFDELLENAKYGTCRGSGVLRKSGEHWKIVQYNLTFTVPNEAAADVVKVIRGMSPAKP